MNHWFLHEHDFCLSRSYYCIRTPNQPIRKEAAKKRGSKPRLPNGKLCVLPTGLTRSHDQDNLKIILIIKLDAITISARRSNLRENLQGEKKLENSEYGILFLQLPSERRCTFDNHTLDLDLPWPGKSKPG